MTRNRSGLLRHGPAAMLLVVLGTASARPALAQETGSGDPDAAEARLLFDDGVAALEREDYATALVAFERAYALAPRPILLYNVGMCQRALLRFTEAIEAFTHYLDEAGPEAPAERRTQVLALIAEMDGHLARLLVTSERDGATILVDGLEVGRTPLDRPLRLTAGRHVVEARLEGFADRRRTVSLMAGESSELALGLEPLGDTDGTAASSDPRTWTGEPEPMPEPADVDGGVETEWWFWTLIGAVVLGGAAATAVLLWPEDEGPASWVIDGP